MDFKLLAFKKYVESPVVEVVVVVGPGFDSISPWHSRKEYRYSVARINKWCRFLILMEDVMILVYMGWLKDESDSVAMVMKYG